ncbi:acylneuraminate cytidylyltransferase family protein [Bradyrhizobium ottawaense]|uniref:acylneuraminate cytidylyltransferase family protein n=1 Tax=Bradyrhizobium ottawaense TaxID=931866 RepID=UPI001BACF978|nr:acylneuraminate cytidylyltransferase family protein [Bradyrhizobium ottawaense]MBR1363459.1 acylneuraminate cytidylyltransferase family protein [Bradyrhizobium ottawaense]
MKTLAIIPARGGSKRLPGKNTKRFLGVPLIAWSIRFAQRQQWFDKVVVSTDSEEIADASRAEGVDVPYLRPATFASDTATSAAVVLDILARERRIGNSFDLIALLQPTSPVREPSRWTEAFAHIDGGVADAVIGVAPAHPHPNHAFHWEQGGKLRPFADGKQITLRSQDLPPVVYVAGNMYLIRSTVLEAQGGFFPPRTVGVLCDQPCEAVDIDTEADWVAAEALAKHYGKSP